MGQRDSKVTFHPFASLHKLFYLAIEFGTKTIFQDMRDNLGNFNLTYLKSIKTETRKWLRNKIILHDYFELWSNFKIMPHFTSFVYQKHTGKVCQNFFTKVMKKYIYVHKE